HPESQGRRRSGAVDERYRIRADGGRLHARREARAQDPRQSARWLRVLELLRSGEPAPALVGRRPFRHRPHAVELWDSDVHGAKGVAFAGDVNERESGLTQISTAVALGPTNLNDRIDSGAISGREHHPNGRLTLSFASIRVSSLS